MPRRTRKQKERTGIRVAREAQLLRLVEATEETMVPVWRHMEHQWKELKELVARQGPIMHITQAPRPMGPWPCLADDINAGRVKGFVIDGSYLLS